MGRPEPQRQYVKWGDVIAWMRWLEAGYGGRIRFVAVQACPKGEQFPKLYWEAHFCDADLNQRPMAQRVLGSFPSSAHATVPGMMLGMLIALDNVLSQGYVWAEPKVAERPAGAEH